MGLFWSRLEVVGEPNPMTPFNLGDLVRLQLDDPDLPDPKYFRAYQNPTLRSAAYLVRLEAVGIILKDIPGEYKYMTCKNGKQGVSTSPWALVKFDKKSFVTAPPADGKVCLPTSRLKPLK